MFRRSLLLLVWLAGAAFAIPLTSPESAYSAEPGAFVSVPVTGSGDAELVVEAPPFLQVVGTPALRAGRALVNLLVNQAAPAGEHQVRIGAGSAALMVTVMVAPRYGVAVAVPDGRTVVSGEELEYALLVTNTGNTPATVLLQVRSSLDAQLASDRLELSGGEAREVVLRLRSTVAIAGSDRAILTATLLEAEETRVFSTIRTEVLPFAGADTLDGPTLRYRLEAGLQYGSAGPGYALGAELAGQLSDYVDVVADLTLRAWPGGDPRLSGYATIAGDRWQVGYRGGLNVHRLDGRYDDFSGHATFAPGSLGFGVSYAPSPLTLSFWHHAATESRQAFTAGYRFQVVPELSVTPSLGVVRQTRGDQVKFSTVVALGADLQTAPVVGSARVRLPFPLGDDWQVAASVSTRVQTPFGVRADATLGAHGFTGSVRSNQEISSEVTLQQRLGYHRGQAALNLGVRYRPTGLQLALGADVSGRLGPGGFGVGYGGNVSYQPTPFTATAHFSVSDAGDLAYGGSFGYQQGGVNAGISYLHTLRSDRLSARLGGSFEGLSGSVSYSYDFARIQHRGDLVITYEFAQGHSLFSTVAVADSLSWQLGATFVVAGGLATPASVVSTFGGRAVGVLSGVVFHDLNRNGAFDEGEKPIVGASVSAGGVSATTDSTGRYQLLLPPGEYILDVNEVAASYGLARSLTPVVELAEETMLNVPLESVATMIVRVFDDRDRNGMAGADEVPLPLVAVLARSADGTVYRQRVDSRGDAVFENLTPARYTVELDGTTLPLHYESTSEPLQVTLESGPIRRLELGAAEALKDVVQTLRAGDLTLLARLDPMSAPPGADVLVVAQVGGTPDEVEASLPDGATVSLTLVGGAYRGRLSVPADAQGLKMVTVTARSGELTQRQQLPLVLAPGPLGEVRTNPTLAGPADRVSVTATLLVRASVVEVEVAGVRYSLSSTDEQYRFIGTFEAPAQTGSHEVTLYADGVELASTRFRVQ